MSDTKMIQVLFNGTRIGEHPDQGSVEANLDEARRVLREAGHDPEAKPSRFTPLAQARSFRAAVHVIYRLGFTRSPFDPNLVAPLIVNTAFCIEVYVKALADAHAMRLRGHGLADLFAQLPEAVRASVGVEFAEQMRSKKQPASKIENALNDMNSAFQDWRYIYEDTRLRTFEVAHAIAIIEALENTAASLKIQT